MKLNVKGTNVYDAQVLIPGSLKALRYKEVFEVNVPVEGSWSNEYNRMAQELLSRLACEVLLSDSDQGVVCASRHLGVSGGVKLAQIGRCGILVLRGTRSTFPALGERAEPIVDDASGVQRDRRGRGNGSRPVPSPWERIRGAHTRIVGDLFEAATMAVSCGHDGEFLHVIVCSSEREDVWDSLLSGADTLGVELSKNPTRPTRAGVSG